MKDPLDPRIHFALVCGAKSCPPIKVYTSGALEEGLEAAASAFCEGELHLLLLMQGYVKVLLEEGWLLRLSGGCSHQLVLQQARASTAEALEGPAACSISLLQS